MNGDGNDLEQDVKDDGQDDGEDVVECLRCGHKGTACEFMLLDPWDSKCPKCGEAQEHVYEV